MPRKGNFWWWSHTHTLSSSEWIFDESIVWTCACRVDSIDFTNRKVENCLWLVSFPSRPANSIRSNAKPASCELMMPARRERERKKLSKTNQLTDRYPRPISSAFLIDCTSGRDVYVFDNTDYADVLHDPWSMWKYAAASITCRTA